MKAMFFLTGIFLSSWTFAQETKYNNPKVVDSVHLQEIYKTPMDTTHLLKPDSINLNLDSAWHRQDSIIRSKKEDDADPKRPPK